jgi:translation initiation factor SUI1
MDLDNLGVANLGSALADIDAAADAADEKKKKKKKPKADEDEIGGDVGTLVHIRVQQRNGRKCITTVQGLDSQLDLKKILKAVKKAECCNGSACQPAGRPRACRSACCCACCSPSLRVRAALSRGRGRRHGAGAPVPG